MKYSIEKTELSERPVLVAVRRIRREEISAAIGEVLPQVFRYAQENGIAPASPPITRYLDMDGDEMTIQPGVCVASSPSDGELVHTDPTEVHWDTLPGGSALKALHQGPYEELHEVYRAMEGYMEAEGMKPRGAPWEIYLTDPGQVPDPSEWKTEIYWPAG